MAELGGVIDAADDANPPAVEMEVAHNRCSKFGDACYWWGLERMVTAEQALDWLEHLSDKKWMGRVDLERLISRIMAAVRGPQGARVIYD
jgi:hypothetical protein